MILNIMEEILNLLQEVIDYLGGISKVLLYSVVIFFIFLGIYFLLDKARKTIIFSPIINRFDKDDSEFGKSLAELLLFKLKFIKKTHELSSKKISLWNTFQDIPSFRQNLDKEIDMLASVQLGNYGKIISGTFAFLFKLFPIFIKPASIHGSINKYGNKVILIISLDNYSTKGFFKYDNLLWEKERDDLKKENIPELIEEIACQIYIDLSGGDLFKSWKCFMLFTQGLKSYINYTELRLQSDLENAESHYKEALKIVNDNPVVKYNLGVLKYYQYKDSLNDEAISYFTSALNCNDRNLRARATSGLAMALGQKFSRYKSGKPDSFETILEAIDSAEKSYQLNKKLDSANIALAYTKHQFGEAMAKKDMGQNESLSNSTKLRREAINYYNKVFNINKKHYVAHNNLANLYLEWAISLKEYSNKKLAVRNILLQLLEKLTNKFIIDRFLFLKKAVIHCEESLKINPSYHIAYDNLGNAFFELGFFDKAYSSYQNAIFFSPNYSEAINDKAMIFLVKEFENYNVSRAIELHQEALIHVSQEENRKTKLINIFKKRMEEYGLNYEEYSKILKG